MEEILFGKTGKIIKSEESGEVGSKIYFAFDQKRGGYSIFLRKIGQAITGLGYFDYWFPTKKELLDHIEGSGWEISWLEEDFF